MTERLMEILEDTCQGSGAPAVAGIVVTHDAVVAQAAVGVRRLGHATPVTLESKFHTGSNAKAMTATICASMVHRGLLGWDSTPLEIFPELGGSILPAYKAITLEMLLRHMAGIPPYTDDEAEDFVVPDWKGVPIEQQIKFFAKWLLQERGPVNEPGTQFSYSNAGYSIAAAMAEAAGGQSWEEMLQAHLFGPLGMEAAAGKSWPALHDPSQPWGHYVMDERIIPQHPDGDYQLEPFLAPAGDVSASITAYGRFLQMNLRGLRGGESFVPSEALWRLHSNGRPGYGMGWGVTAMRSMEALGLFSTHAGSAGTFIMVAGISHARDRAVAVATNSGANAVIDLGFKRMIPLYVGSA